MNRFGQHIERRMGMNHSGENDYLFFFPLALDVPTKVQHILTRRKGEIISSEMLIDAPESDINYLLGQSDVRFELFCSQLHKAFCSGKNHHINLEISDLMRSDFPERLDPILKKFRRKSDRKRVTIEITERGTKKQIEDREVERNLWFLSQKGFQIYVDDYDIFGMLEGNISQLIFQRFQRLISGVKIPHEYCSLLLQFDDRNPLESIPSTQLIIAEGMGLAGVRYALPKRVQAIQDPLYSGKSFVI